MDYVAWEIFTWAIGLVVGVTGIAIKYMIDKINDIKIVVDEKVEERERDCKNLDMRVTEMSTLNQKTQLGILGIQKDIEYIKLDQAKISIKLDELLKK